jgi:hypothetical protein
MRHNAIDTGSIPVTLEIFKTHINYTGSDIDALLTLYLNSATKAAESFLLDKPIITKTVTMIYTDMLSRFDLKYVTDNTTKPVISYTDENGDPQVVSASDLQFVQYGPRPFVAFLPDLELPTIKEGTNVEIEYTAQWDSIPSDVLGAIYMIGADMERKREDYVRKLPTAAEYLLAPYQAPIIYR